VAVVVAGQADVRAHLQRPLHHALLVVDDDARKLVDLLRLYHVVHEEPVHAAQVVRELEAVVAEEDDGLAALEALDHLREALQAMVGLGLVPNPLAPKGEPQKADLPQAQHTIDTLQMLYDKTQGNRTTEETEQIEHILHELRMAFVSVKQHLGPGQQ